MEKVEHIQWFNEWLEGLHSSATAVLALRALAQLIIQDMRRETLGHPEFTSGEVNEKMEELSGMRAKNQVTPTDIRKFLQRRGQDYLQYLAARNATHRVAFDTTNKEGGAGLKGKWFLKPVEIIAPGSEQLETTSEDSIRPSTIEDQRDGRYFATPARQGWELTYTSNDDPKLGLIARVFFDGNRAHFSKWRGKALAAWVSSGFLGLTLIAVFIWLGLVLAPQMRAVTFLSGLLFVLVLGAFLYFRYRPWFRAFEDRIGPAPTVLLALAENRAVQLEVGFDGHDRYLALRRYTGTCPICAAQVYLDDGAPEYQRRMIGRCLDSPREHIFSFDRVSRRGVHLRPQDVPSP